MLTSPPSAVAVTICLNGFARVSPAAKTPGTVVAQSFGSVNVTAFVEFKNFLEALIFRFGADGHEDGAHI